MCNEVKCKYELQYKPRLWSICEPSQTETSMIMCKSFFYQIVNESKESNTMLHTGVRCSHGSDAHRTWGHELLERRTWSQTCSMAFGHYWTAALRLLMCDRNALNHLVIKWSKTGYYLYTCTTFSNLTAIHKWLNGVKSRPALHMLLHNTTLNSHTLESDYWLEVEQITSFLYSLNSTLYLQTKRKWGSQTWSENVFKNDIIVESFGWWEICGAFPKHITITQNEVCTKHQINKNS